MTIAVSGTAGVTTWTDGFPTKAVGSNFGSVQANSVLLMSTAIVSLDTIPAYVYQITDTQGNVWRELSAISYSSWVTDGDIRFKDNGPVALTTQLWYALDPSSPASGYTATLSIQSVLIDDSGIRNTMAMDAGIAHLIRVSGLNFTWPLDDNAFSGGVSLVNTNTDGVRPTMTNSIASNSTNIALCAVFGGVGTLQGANVSTDFTNNGVTNGADFKMRTDINGWFDGGPAQNAVGLVTNLRMGAIGPWNGASNQIINLNSMHIDEMLVRTFTADTQPVKKHAQSRIIT